VPSTSAAKSHPALQTYFFHLVGGQKTLPEKEIDTILASSGPYKLLERKENCVVVQCTYQTAKETASRAAYCRRSVELLVQGNDQQEVTKETVAGSIEREIDFATELAQGQSYAVRVHKSTRGASKINTSELEARVGNSIWRQTKKNKSLLWWYKKDSQCKDNRNKN
jgi:tRNA G10  N-methylase Trm11